MEHYGNPGGMPNSGVFRLKESPGQVNQRKPVPTVDGFSVHVPNAYRYETLNVFEHNGLNPRDLDGRSGDGLEREIAAGSIDGDEPQNLRLFADVLDTLDQMNVPYSAEVLAYGKYDAVGHYMQYRGRVDYEAATSY